MRKFIFSLSALLIFTFYCTAQTPQFAVVKPNGTTTITTSFDDAYTVAVDDDIIYMPGITITGDKTISKKLTLIGAGHYPDSTIYTGKTIFTGQMYLENKCTLEGFELINSITITNANGANSTFSRLKFSNLYLLGTNNHYLDGCVFSSITGSDVANSCLYSSSNILIKNSIFSYLDKISFSNFNNCLFLGPYLGNTLYFSTANSIFSNCIFRGRFYIDWGFQTMCYPLAGNTSNNSLWINNTNTINIPGTNNYSSTVNELESGNSGSFEYTYNYHLRSGSPYLTAGADGTEIGIYGGPTPYKEGAVPSNPHIYFKQVAPQTNNNGQLQIQFKVRTNN